jgi:hypothetical protein
MTAFQEKERLDGNGVGWRLKDCHVRRANQFLACTCTDVPRISNVGVQPKPSALREACFLLPQGKLEVESGPRQMILDAMTMAFVNPKCQPRLFWYMEAPQTIADHV